MATADEFNHDEIISGRLTMAEITELVKAFQAAHGLVVDGKAGPKTQEVIDQLLPPAAPAPDHAVKFLSNPLPVLGGHRHGQITSEFRPPDRPKHNGVDMFYAFKPGDKPDFTTDGGAAAGKDGKPKWVVPFGISAIAAAPGKVQVAGNSPTGYRVWIDHGNGLRSGYFHLMSLVVNIGQIVALAQPLGLVGHNPSPEADARHLHFELSPVDRYAPMDPTPYLKL